MNTSQIGGISSTENVSNRGESSTVDQLLPGEILLTREPLVAIATRNANIPARNNVTRRQQHPQGRRARRNELLRQEAERRQQVLQQRLIRRQRGQRRYERRQQRLLQRDPDLEQARRIQREHNREQERLRREQQYQQRVANYHPPMRQPSTRYADDWEEEQWNEWEAFVDLQQLISIQDELEQERHIDAAQELLLEDEEQKLRTREAQEQIGIQQYEASIENTIE